MKVKEYNCCFKQQNTNYISYLNVRHIGFYCKVFETIFF